MPIVKTSKADAEKYLKDFDWSEIDAMTDEDIARQIEDNPDAAQPLDAAHFEHAALKHGNRIVRRGRPRKDARAVVAQSKAGDKVDLAAVRSRLGMTQAQFAQAYRFSVAAIRDLEQGRRKPTGPTQALLELIAADPEYVRRQLQR